MRIPTNKPTPPSNNPQERNVNTKQEPAPVSNAVKRAENKLRKEYAEEKKQMNKENLENMINAIHMHQAHNPKSVAFDPNKRYDNLTGSAPDNFSKIFGNVIGHN